MIAPRLVFGALLSALGFMPGACAHVARPAYL
jgi:hypothetical protein